ncbi:type II secretion system protein [bacterium]|nr:type II secretion system protein [bacterium]
MKNSKAKGFTIVEVLFVLAIGGLILMMVFLAIPAINRWNNNSKRKADVSAILQAVSDYRLQNMGRFPDTTNPLTFPALSIYVATNVTIKIPIVSGLNTDPNSVTDSSKIYIYNNALCDTTTTGKFIAGGSRDIVALYALDPSMSQCRQL